MLAARARRLGLDIELSLAPDGPQDIRDAYVAGAVWAAAEDHGHTELASDALAELRSLLSAAGDRRQVLSDHILLAPGADALPWREIIPPARGLALLYNFSPFQDTGSTVASKRIRQLGASMDVIACSFLHHKKMDPTIERISAPYVTSKHFLPFPPSWATWPAHAGFAMRAAALAERYMALRGSPYDFLYSRAMWSPSLVAGGLVKLRNPALRWIAEFSDPLSQDVTGRHRGGPIGDDDCSRELITAVENRFGSVTAEEKSIFAIAELVAFAFADEIIFTNAHQKQTMLAKISRPDLRERVESVAVVSHHPSLPRPFYEMFPTSTQVSEDHLNVAYFGEFYSSRGLIEVTSGMRALPRDLRERTRLHVFTNYVPSTHGGQRPRNFSPGAYAELVQRALNGVGAQGIEHLVTFHPSLPFLRFLAATDDFDLLVVRDASTAGHHAVNPYLPSKWSDYSNSRAQTWAVVEPGSVIDGMRPRFRSAVGDVRGARAVLWDALEEKFGTSTVREMGVSTDGDEH